MKRSDDSRLIKIPDANAVAAATGGGGSGGPHLIGQQNSATIAPVFPQRPSNIDMPQQPVGGQGVSVQQQQQQQQQHPMQAHRAGVTVYRGEPHSSNLPPAAHTGVIVTATPSPGVGYQFYEQS